MEDTNQMLSQEEIDAMVGKSAAKPAPAHKIMPASSPVKTATAAPPVPNVQKVNVSTPKSAAEPAAQGHHSAEDCIAAGDIKSIHEQLNDIATRLARLELVVHKMENNAPSPAAQASPAALKAAVQQIQNVSSQVEVISEGLRGTAGYNISKTFSCTSCGTVGVVAVKVKCTKCGQESWWGWWPKKK